MQSRLQPENENGNGIKKKIIIKKKSSQTNMKDVASSLSIRLIDFNIYDKNVEVSTTDADANVASSFYQNKKTVIQIFGINESGETCSLFVEDMNPFFYVLVPDTWNEYTKKNFISSIIK